MKRAFGLFAVLGVLTLAACGDTPCTGAACHFVQPAPALGEVVPPTTAASTPVNCTVTKEGTVATITCPDGSSVQVSDGATGATGPQGYDGQPGSGVYVTELPVGHWYCTYGGIAVMANDVLSYVCNGAPGADGATGPTGPAGQDGTIVPVCPEALPLYDTASAKCVKVCHTGHDTWLSEVIACSKPS